MHIFQSKFEKISIHEWNLFNKINLFPGDYHLVNLRTLNQPETDSKMNPSKKFALILRRFAYDCDDNYDSSFHFEQVNRSLSSLIKIDRSFSFFSPFANISFHRLKLNLLIRQH